LPGCGEAGSTSLQVAEGTREGRATRVFRGFCGYRGDHRARQHRGVPAVRREVRLTTVKGDIPDDQGFERNGLNQSVSWGRRGGTRIGRLWVVRVVTRDTFWALCD